MIKFLLILTHEIGHYIAGLIMGTDPALICIGLAPDTLERAREVRGRTFWIFKVRLPWDRGFIGEGAVYPTRSQGPFREMVVDVAGTMAELVFIGMLILVLVVPTAVAGTAIGVWIAVEGIEIPMNLESVCFWIFLITIPPLFVLVVRELWGSSRADRGLLLGRFRFLRSRGSDREP